MISPIRGSRPSSARQSGPAAKGVNAAQTPDIPANTARGSTGLLLAAVRERLDAMPDGKKERRAAAPRLVIEAVLMQHFGRDAKRDAELQRLISEVTATIETAEQLRLDMDVLRNRL